MKSHTCWFSYMPSVDSPSNKEYILVHLTLASNSVGKSDDINTDGMIRTFDGNSQGHGSL